VLVRHRFLSLDPYMRGRMNDAKSYAKPQLLNEVMGGGTVGEVVASRHAGYQPGDSVVGMGGWQQYSLVDGSTPGVLRKVDTSRIALSAYLGAVGMPGVTAWYGLMKICDRRRDRQRRQRRRASPARQGARRRAVGIGGADSASPASSSTARHADATALKAATPDIDAAS
jgi:hypothetical protein